MNFHSSAAFQPPTQGLLEDLAALSNDPFRFVLWAFPWGEVGTELEKASGPETWQEDILKAVRDGLPLQQAIQIAVASGHGIGKSTLVAWLILWAFSTFEDTRGVVTANTENQLKTKTWVELSKWFRLFIAKELFHLSLTRLRARDPEHEETWRIDQVPWSERNTEAFAGLHNQGKRIILVMDEASAIPDVIWETAEGALTDKPPTQILWVCFGNPTRNTGRFRDCFGKFAHRWTTKQVDSREVSFTDKAKIAEWAEDYGEDSDFFRVRVKGVFPKAGTSEFISLEMVREARKRQVEVWPSDPIVLGCDVARFGDDKSIIYVRRGRDGKSIPPKVFSGIDTMSFATQIANTYTELRADAVFVDGTGVGGGVVDRLRQLRVPVFDIQFGAKPDRAGELEDRTLYGFKVDEMWGYMREWLKIGAIHDRDDLQDELVGREYTITDKGAIRLERKQDMKSRGLPSPDFADALALTFAYPVVSRAFLEEGPAVQTEYDPYESMGVAA